MGFDIFGDINMLFFTQINTATNTSALVAVTIMLLFHHKELYTSEQVLSSLCPIS